MHNVMCEVFNVRHVLRGVFHVVLVCSVINRPGVAGAVLQTPLN